jgi:ubiquitin C-terminal hydrolase
MYCSKQAGLFPPAGLKNFGATCYLNALIQVRVVA